MKYVAQIPEAISEIMPVSISEESPAEVLKNNPGRQSSWHEFGIPSKLAPWIPSDMTLHI